MKSFHEEESLGRIYDHRLARKLLRCLLPYRWVVSIAVLLLIVVSALRLVPPLLTETAIDRHIENRDMEGLATVAQIYLLVLIVQFVVSFAQTYLTNWTGQKIMYDLRMRIFRHLQKQDLAYFNRTPVGRLITRMTTDVDVLNELFTSGVVSIFGDIVSLGGIIAVMFWLDWRLALVCLSVVPALFAVTLVFKRIVRGTYRRVRTAIARINAFLQESITGMSVVQVFVQEDRKFREFDERNREHLDANLDSILAYAVYYPVIDLVGALSIALILWYGGLNALEGAVTLGVLVAFIQYAERFYKPISDLSEKFNILQSAMASSERIFDLLETEPEIVPPSQPRRLERVEGSIEFRDVSFSYRPGTPVLRNLSFRVRPGEKVAVVGATGSGKSTIINLLCRFYDVDEGRVLIDGVDVREMDLAQLRRAVVVVLQDVFLFSATVEENIRLWSRPLDGAEVRKAAGRVHADAFVERLPDGYSTAVSERGSSLSVGQRQLLAFARALAHTPRILVLDEATSSVDTETELLIQSALEKLMEGHTSVIIAHRLSTIQHCDRIIVLHKGEIREEGTHAELLRREGLYHKLYQYQLGRPLRLC
jgi:ATP-binding cassette, subfamily B, multidrug efflux pump